MCSSDTGPHRLETPAKVARAIQPQRGPVEDDQPGVGAQGRTAVDVQYPLLQQRGRVEGVGTGQGHGAGTLFDKIGAGITKHNGIDLQIRIGGTVPHDEHPVIARGNPR